MNELYVEDMTIMIEKLSRTKKATSLTGSLSLETDSFSKSLGSNCFQGMQAITASLLGPEDVVGRFGGEAFILEISE